MNKHFLNEKGITLVELLAALSLFAIVSALVMTVLFNVFQNSENISDNAQLRQDANLLVSTLRSHYNQGDFKVGLNDNNSLLIDGQEVNSSMTSSIDELELKNGENSISAVNDSMIVTADGTPLSINLTLKNEAGQTYNLFTTIEKPAELAIATLPIPPDRPEVFTRVKKPDCFSEYVNTEYDFSDYDFGDYYHLIPSTCTKDIKDNKDITIEGHVLIPIPDDSKSNVEFEMGPPDNKVKFHVEKNLFVEPMFNIDNRHLAEHPMTVEGDAVFKRKLELKEKGELSVNKNIFAHNKVVVNGYTTLKTGQSMVVDQLFLKGYGHAEIGKNLFANTVEAANVSTINIIGSASISEELKAENNSELKIGKNLIIKGDLEMYDNVEIIVEGNARINGNLILGGNSKLKVEGNLTVTGDVEPDGEGNNGTLDVTEDTNFSKGTPSWLNFED